MVLSYILGYIIVPRNVLVNTDLDLFVPTFAAMSFNLIYLFLGIFIFVTYILKIKKLKHSRVGQINYRNHHLCSIVVPARDEENVIKDSIRKCLQQTYQNIEILVIAHNSSDGTYEAASEISDNRVRAFDLNTKASGKAIALNYGIEQSRGDYVLIMDADTILDDRFVERAMPKIVDSRYVAVQGRVFPINRNYNLLTRLMAMEDDLWQEPIMTVRTIIGERCPLLGTAFIIKKEIVMQEGMFKNSLVDDHELTCRLLKRRHKIVYLPYCKAYAEEPPILEVMLRQRARWGRGFINCLGRKMADSGDIIGLLLWIMPLASFANSIMFSIVVYATIFNMLFEYLPYSFAYLPLQIWFLVAGTMFSLYLIVLIRVHGVKEGLRQSILLPLFIAFSQYGLVVCYKALFVRTWGNTKTVHGLKRTSPKVTVGPSRIN